MKSVLKITKRVWVNREALEIYFALEIRAYLQLVNLEDI